MAVYFNVPNAPIYSVPLWSTDATRAPWPQHMETASRMMGASAGLPWGMWNAKALGTYADWAQEGPRRDVPQMQAPGNAAPEPGARAWDLSEEPGLICLVNSLTSGACASLCAEAERADVVGLDAEWVPDWTQASDNPISVLQLAFPSSGRVYVIQLGALSRQLPQAVQLMLLNPEVTKVGFACSHKDASKLASSGIVVTKGSMVDVQSRCAAMLGVPKTEGRSLSLKRAARELLGFILEKDRRHTLSDWSAARLSPDQVRYAALDAWVALRLFYRTS